MLDADGKQVKSFEGEKVTLQGGETRVVKAASIDASNVKVTEAEVQEAYDTIDPQLVETIRKSLKNTREYHEKQKQYSWFDTTTEGTMLGRRA